MTFKNTSENTQRREVNRVLNSTSNTGGIDPSVFKPVLPPERTERDKLIDRKQALQEKNSKLSAQIASAKRRHFFKERGTVTLDTVLKWEEDRRSTAREITEIDRALTNMRVDKHLASITEKQNFDAVFVQVAKEKLAEPVYKELARLVRERLPGA